jgi:hypothetical protein
MRGAQLSALIASNRGTSAYPYHGIYSRYTNQISLTNKYDYLIGRYNVKRSR